MSEFPAETFRNLLPALLQLSDQQMAQWVREKLTNLHTRSHTPIELYDLFAEIAALPITRIEPHIVVGDISGFVQAFCDVTKHYFRPDESARYNNEFNSAHC